MRHNGITADKGDADMHKRFFGNRLVKKFVFVFPQTATQKNLVRRMGGDVNGRVGMTHLVKQNSVERDMTETADIIDQ